MKDSSLNISLKVEKWIFTTLSKNIKNIRVYSHVPEDARLPFIRIGEINWQSWLVIPTSFKANITITIFSGATSNSQAMIVANDVDDVLRCNVPKEWLILDVLDHNVYQLKDQTWCLDITIVCMVYDV